MNNISDVKLEFRYWKIVLKVKMLITVLALTKKDISEVQVHSNNFCFSFIGLILFITNQSVDNQTRTD